MPAKRLSLLNEEEMKLTKKLMEDMELKKLTRLERLMKDDSIKDGTIEKQQKVIDVLSKERSDLVNNLSVMQTLKRCIEDHEQAKDVDELFSQADKLDMEIAQERKYINDLKAQIQKESIQIEQHRRNIQTTATASDFRLVEENNRKDNLMESLNTRLHNEQVQLSTIIKDNANLRKEIDLLLKTKGQFNKLYEELIEKLNKGKKIVSDIAEQSNLQFLKRDEMARKIEALKDRDAADLKKRQEEMQDLEMKLSEDVETSIFRQQVARVRGKLNDTARGTKRTDALRQQQETLLKELIKTWNFLKEETQLEECQEICDMLVKQEQENFSLFNFNNELRYQLEALIEKTTHLIKEVEDEQDKAVHWEEEQDRVNNHMAAKLTSLQEQNNDVSDSCDKSNRLFERLLSKIRIIFDLLKCNHFPLDQLLGANEEVTKFNYNLYLDMIETALMALVSCVPKIQDKLPTIITNKISATSAVPVKAATVIITDKKVLSNPCSQCEEMKKHPGSISFVLK